MKKRIASFLLALVIICSAVPTALAAGWSNPFTDVSKNDWFYDGVEYVCSNGLFNGVTSTSFQPEATMNRAMLVTCLWRLNGSPAASDSSFSDVPSGQYYSKPVAWASSNSLVNGVGDNKFDPNGNITREQLVSIMLRYCRFTGKNPTERRNLSGFPDASSVSSYAKEAFEWAVAVGILNGVNSGGTTIINPQGSAPRNQVAIALMRFDRYLKNETPDVPDIPSAAAEDTLTVGGKSYFIGMTEAQLTSTAGNADDSFPSIYGYTCYIYGAKNYSNFFMAGVKDGKVVTLCSAGTGFSYMGKAAGATNFSFSGSDKTRVNAMTDENDNDILHCIQLTDKSFRSVTSYSSETLYGESKLNFHLVNAFRQYHGRSVLTWCDKAAASARLHSEDMAENNYFDHISLDGRNPGARMRAQGISWRACGENIIAGYGGAIVSHDGWVNSSGHRDNILGRSYTRLGVGFAYESGSYYGIYGTENFYA